MKHMKLKVLAAAVLAIGASSAFAKATPTTCDATTSLSLVNTCTPEVTLYVAGSSALGGAISTTIATEFASGYTTVIDNGSPSGNQGNLVGTSTANNSAVSAWYGIGATGTAAAGKRLLVVYNNQNGSAAGISQLLSGIKDTTIPEQDVVTVGPLVAAGGAVATAQSKAFVANACTLPSTSAPTTVSCTSHARTQADLGISDVAPVELFALEGAKPAAISTLTNYPLAMQGFGVAVNNNFYLALQNAQATALTAGGCAASFPLSAVDTTAACQPSIRKADYTSLVSTTGSVKSAAGFIPGDATLLTLARRDDFSGTQASSNIFFLDNACGVAVDSKGKAIKGVLGGALTPLVTTPDATKLVVHLNATSGKVKTDLAASTGYTIGIIGLNTLPDGTWKYVKVDGVSPDGAGADAKQRNAFTTGYYEFAVESYASVSSKAAKTSVANTGNTYHALVTEMVNALKNSNGNLKGIGYLDKAATDHTPLTTAGVQSTVTRTAGNNCSPLTAY